MTRNPIRGRLELLRARRRARAARRQRRDRAGHRLLEAFADSHPKAVFIEIGANDGEREDHLAPFIRRRGWSGVMVEPVPEVFERLRRNYAGAEGVALENAAISDHDGRASFHTLVADGTGDGPAIDGADMFGSLSPGAVEAIAQAFPDHPRRIETIEVPCLSFESLCRKHGVEGADVLVIDTEGHDHEILRQIDFDRIRPRIVVYEYCHLEPEVRRACVNRLERVGYLTMDEELDTWAVDVRPADELSRRWRELRAKGPAVSEEDLRRWYQTQEHGA